MLVKSIKEKLVDNKIEDIIKVKSYIPFIEKKILCNKVIDSSLERDENGMLYCNYFDSKIVKDISILSAYANIEFGDEILAEYDYLCENKIMQYVLNNMDYDEIDFIENMIYEVTKEKIDIENSLGNIIKNGIDFIAKKIPSQKEINSIINKLPKKLDKMSAVMDKLPKSLENIKPEDLNVLKNIISKEN